MLTFAQPVHAQASNASEPAQPVVAVKSADRAAAREELLLLGFGAASAIPVDPHERDRALVQESVARTCVELGFQTRAMAMANDMTGWRSGMVWSALAIDAAKSDRPDAARTFIRFALATIGSARDWQRDRVRVGVAQAHAWLGEREQAAELEKGVGEPEQGKVRSALAARSKGEEFDAQIESAEKAAATRNFDLTANALDTAVELASKTAGDEKRWERIVALADAAAGGIPRDMHMKAYLRLADARTAQGAKDKARELILRAVKVRDSAKWMPEAEPPMAADIARRLYAVGDSSEARAELERALGVFEASKAKVADVFRAAAIRPAAEAFMAMGDPARAKALFMQAIEEGAANPNARPRAMDLAENCAAIARSGIEVDEAMWTRLREIRSGLTQPW